MIIAVLDEEKIHKAFRNSGMTYSMIADMANEVRDIITPGRVENLFRYGQGELNSTVKILKAMKLSPEEVIKEKVDTCQKEV